MSVEEFEYNIHTQVGIQRTSEFARIRPRLQRGRFCGLSNSNFSLLFADQNTPLNCFVVTAIFPLSSDNCGKTKTQGFVAAEVIVSCLMLVNTATNSFLFHLLFAISNNRRPASFCARACLRHTLSSLRARLRHTPSISDLMACTWNPLCLYCSMVC